MWNHCVLIAVAVLGIGLANTDSRATEPDADAIARITGRKPEVNGGVMRLSVPRTDLTVRVDGVSMVPFQGLTSWAAFQASGTETMVMGDVVVTEDEANSALTAALENGLEVTALHNHFFFDDPHVFFMHIGGHGTTARLAAGVKATLDAVDEVAKKRAANGGKPRERDAGRAIPKTSSIDPKPLEGLLKVPAQAKDGMAKFVIGRTTNMHGAEAGAAMGVNTWAVFAGSADAALVDGDFAMLEGEVQNVLKALRRGGIEIVAIHNHMIGEEARITFLHFWGMGRATDLASTIKAALDTQRS